MLYFVFFVFTHVIYFMCPGKGTGCLENWTLSIVYVASHLRAFLYSGYWLSIFTLDPTLKNA